jgi:hypothetical protein
MRRALATIQWLWWAAVAALPIIGLKLQRAYMDAIGCPPRGDCYVPGSRGLHYWDAHIFLMAAILWPICAWFLFVAPWRRPESK